jgi:FAD/FMN-containing dehydrogenase
MITSDVVIARLEDGPVRLTSEELDALAAHTDGRLLLPGDAGWNNALVVWNALAARTPALILQPSSARDVSAAIDFARERDLLVSIKGGGHNVAGTSFAERALALDMSRMRDVAVDPDAKLVHVGPGCLLKDVDRATQKHGLATVLGLMSETGVAGLTLGGGFGYLTRRFGWAVDNLQEVEIVTADGVVRTANREENADLFWALRGGGGNFGVVTRFTFRVHRVGPSITGGMAVWSADRADDILSLFREVTESAPRELTAILFVGLAPAVPFLGEQWHGKPIVSMLVCHSGSNAEAHLAPIRDVGEPLADLIGETSYAEQQSMFDDDLPTGLNYYLKSEYLSALSSDFLATFGSSALKVTSPRSEAMIVHIGGAVNEKADDDGAVGNRDARYVAWFDAVWQPGDSGDEHVAWARDAWDGIRRFSTGGNYVNFQTGDDNDHRVHATYGSNFERLVKVKKAYDPDNAFRVNRNIRSNS